MSKIVICPQLERFNRMLRDGLVRKKPTGSPRYKNMQRNIAPVAEKKLSYTFFWLDDEKFGEFSNWYERPFIIDDFIYFCVEQYMMAQKAKLFHDAENYTKILRANTAKGCKWLGENLLGKILMELREEFRV